MSGKSLTSLMSVDPDGGPVMQDLLDVIDDVARLRRKISAEIEELKERIEAHRPKKKSQFMWFLQLRFDPTRVGFASANFEQQAAVYEDVRALWQAKALRAKAYGTDISAVRAAQGNARITLLLDIQKVCERELSVDIPKLRGLTTHLESLRASYNEILRK